jgi:hypothetical protein
MSADREVCGAERFMRSSGPSRVPLRACCAAAILHAAEGAATSAPFVCAEAGRLTARTEAEVGRLTARTDAEVGRLTARTEVQADRLASRTEAAAGRS